MNRTRSARQKGVAEEIEQRLQPDEVDCAIAMLAALQANPPTSMPADTQQALQDMLQRARQVQSAADIALVNAALQKLREKPDDEQARQAILKLVFHHTSFDGWLGRPARDFHRRDACATLDVVHHSTCGRVLGSRAAPTLREALREALRAEQPDANQIQQLHDLLKTLVPEWPGFAPDAT